MDTVKIFAKIKKLTNYGEFKNFYKIIYSLITFSEVDVPSVKSICKK